ncbi:hypothetical protein [Chitinophaga sp.]|uniref:hypothetical protein n=1 Tax=Chitinophaga sp. TaxID=1869181 RepID=UPI002F93D2D3
MTQTSNNMPDIFKEQSSVFRPIFLLTFIPVLAILIALLIKGIKHNDLSDIIPASLFILINLLVILILGMSKLTLLITETGISFSYRPYVVKNTTYNWEQIASVQLLQIDLLKEFKGWGKKYSKQYGWGYLTKGDYIIHLILKNGNKVTLSILNPQKAALLIPSYLHLPVSRIL